MKALPFVLLTLTLACPGCDEFIPINTDSNMKYDPDLGPKGQPPTMDPGTRSNEEQRDQFLDRYGIQ